RSTSATGSTMTSSFISKSPVFGFVAAGSSRVCVPAMVASVCRWWWRLARAAVAASGRFRGEFGEACSKHAIEGGGSVDGVGERLHRRAELDREHELAQDLARTRRDQCRADQRPALAVADQLERAAVKVMDVASCRLGRVGAGDDDIDASLTCASLRQSDRS